MSTAPDDMDQDSLPDWWEHLNGLSTSSSVGDDGPDGDLDKDAVSNRDEYVADTKANDSNSKLILEFRPAVENETLPPSRALEAGSIG